MLQLVKKICEKIKLYLSFPTKYRESLIAVEEIKKIKGKEIDTVIILLKGIGDTVYGLAYLNEIVKKYGKILVIGNKNHESLIRAYSEEIEFCPYDINRADYSMFKAYMDCERIKKINPSFILFNTDPYHVYNRRGTVHENSAINLLKDKIFRIGDTCEITYPPVLSCEVKAIPNFKEIASHIIVLNPYSNSISNIRSEVYERIVCFLKEYNFDVYTNITLGQQLIRGTKPLTCSISELYTILQSVAGIVSIRSGILDLAINTGTPMFVIYSDCTKKFCEIYNLSAWKGKSPVNEVYYDKMKDVELYRVFEEWCENLKRL